MEQDIPFGNSNRENGTTFLDFPLFLGIFQWNEPTKRVPFTTEPEIPEILTKWKAPQDSDCSDSDSDVASVKTLNAFVNGVASKKDKQIYGEMHIRSNQVRRQADRCGATVSIIPKSHISDIQLEPANISLEVCNKEKMQALGTCKLSLQNPKISQKYIVNFVVFSRKSSSPC